MSVKGPLVGTSAVVVRGGRVLLGQRLGSYGDATWAPPGGKVEAGESPEAGVERELEEETGLVARRVSRITWTNDVFAAEGTHFVTLHHLVEAVGQPRTREPHKARNWDWYEWDSLPTPLFSPVVSLLETGWRPPAF